MLADVEVRDKEKVFYIAKPACSSHIFLNYVK
jgi:hypothetical protein